MLKHFRLAYFYTPARVVAWWNDIVSMIEAVLSASNLDLYVVFGCAPLLERYARSKEQPLHDLDMYQLFVSALIVASKIICPLTAVPWASILKERCGDKSVNWMQREFLITVGWDRWMMEIVDEVWGAYDEAVKERKGEPSNSPDANTNRLSWTHSSVTVDSPSRQSHFSSQSEGTGSSSSTLPRPPSLFLTRSRRGSGPSTSGVSLARTPSSLWENYMQDRTRPDPLDTDMDEFVSAMRVAPYVEKSMFLEVQKPPSSNPRALRTRLSRIFKSK
ncbi:hypothetical protein FA13DRAFT_888105 [Coprinellus micaceus]|uniref:Cyclin N-terminal domain-containing protein n=1 Tax=Coprinellus micaceus TaxID=71717 RepID=A0A4Y7TT37_COPMI|nr:hypothetical protein FA13DRAFT_888105 [Coprinellus micaceus]